jgi:predicted GNAT family N-acyltransferase
LDTSHITVREVVFASEDYRRMIACRNKVLREPMGRTLSEQELARDASLRHFAAFDAQGSVVGTVLLESQTDTRLRARQVSVHPTVQGKGVGALLMRFVEETGRKEGFTEMVLHARETAVPFYMRLGYIAEGDFFEESTLPHIFMRRSL